MTIQEKTEYQADLFSNRLLKNYKNLKKWARKNRISCIRLYDKDIPEIPLAVDLYTFLPSEITDKTECAKYMTTVSKAISENSKESLQLLQEELSRTYILIYLYERPYEKSEAEEELWLNCMKQTAADALKISNENVLIKKRRHQSSSEKQGRAQYEKEISDAEIKGLVQEQGQLFNINLSNYIDTGLFNDMRLLRKEIRDISSAKKVLNLFCYTGSFSVYAAEGGAKSVTSVDLSNTYLEWAKKNMSQNGFTDLNKYSFVRADCIKYIKEQSFHAESKFDIIILDPPTFSNSKKTEQTLDINRDWPELVNDCLTLLSKNGILYFSSNSRSLIFEESKLNGATAKDITAKTIPEDYRNKKIHRVWEIKKQKTVIEY